MPIPLSFLKASVMYTVLVGYYNLLKIGPHSKISPPLFLNEIVAKDAFLLKVCPPIYAIVHAVMQSKKHRRSSTMQEEGLTNDHRYYLHKASA